MPSSRVARRRQTRAGTAPIAPATWWLLVATALLSPSGSARGGGGGGVAPRARADLARTTTTTTTMTTTSCLRGGVVVADASVVVVDDGVLAHDGWRASVTSPALERGDDDAPSDPGAVELSPGGALRLTRASSSSAGADDDDDDDDARVVIVVLGAPNDAADAAADASLTIDAWTSDGLRRSCALDWRGGGGGGGGGWRLAADASSSSSSSSSAPCTLHAVAAEEADAAATPSGARAHANGTRARVELGLGAARGEGEGDVVAVVVRESASVVVDAPSPSPSPRFTMSDVVVVHASDVEMLRWAWLERAARCAASLRPEVRVTCGVDALQTTPEFGLAPTVETLTGGCCDAVAAYVAAACECAIALFENSGNGLSDGVTTTTMTAAAALARVCGVPAAATDGGVACAESSAILAAIRDANAAAQVRSIHWFPYDPVGEVDADP